MEPNPLSSPNTVFPPGVMLLVPSEPVLFDLRETLLEKSPAGVLLYPKIHTVKAFESSLGRELGIVRADNFSERFVLNHLAPDLWKVLGIPGEMTFERLTELSMELGSALERVKLSGLSYGEMEKIEPTALSGVLADIGRRFEAEIAPRHTRSSRRREILEALKGGREFHFLRGLETVHFMFFQRLAPFELELVKALALGFKVNLSLSVPNWATNETEMVRSGFLRISLMKDLENSGLDNLTVEYPPDVAKARLGNLILREENPDPALLHASGNLFGPPLSPEEVENAPPVGDALTMVEAPNLYMEAEAALRLIKSKVISGDKAQRMALVIPSVQNYLPQVEDVARRFGIRFRHQKGFPLETSGPALAFLDFLSLFGSNYEGSRLARILASPYFDFGLKPGAPILETLRKHGVTDDRAGGGFAENLAKAADRDAAAILRAGENLVAADRALSEAGDWESFFRVFDDILKKFHWPEGHDPGPEELTANHPRLRQASSETRVRDVAGSIALSEVYERLKIALLAEKRAPKVSKAEFAYWLEKTVGRTYVRSDADENPAGRVRLLTYRDIHGAYFDTLVMIGLNERVYPKGVVEGSFWPKSFVEGFKKTPLKRSLWNTPVDSYNEEEEVVQGALAQANQVYLFWSAKEKNNRAAKPAHFISGLAALFPEGALKPKKPEALGLQSPPKGSMAADENELRLYLLSLPEDLREKALEKSGIRLKDLVPGRSRFPRTIPDFAAPEVIENYLRQRGKTDSDGPTLTADALKTYADCPRAFWFGEILGLEPLPEEIVEFPAKDRGTILHKTLEKFLRPLVGIDVRENQELVSWERLRESFDETAREHQKSRPVGRRPVFEAVLSKSEHLLKSWHGRQDFKGDGTITAVEWEFDVDKGNAVKIGTGADAFYLRGRVDRIDVSPRGSDNPVYVAKDYKLRFRDDYKIWDGTKGQVKTTAEDDPARDGPNTSQYALFSYAM
ncbi:MAG: PD-(D/E)XK nuclease family protein, partial [Deltaproteobacteria bacterium]|nr:PD-(D/E)XK nuclease family protein [Deltaproteobacteria bacterium]